MTDAGGYFRRTIRWGNSTLTIYVDLMSRMEYMTSEMGFGAPEDEARATARAFYDRPGVLGYGRHYSPRVPDGEYGSLPDGQPPDLVKITKDEFEAAKANGWQP